MLKLLRRLVVFRDKDHIHFSFGGFITSYTLQSVLAMLLILKVYEYLSPTIHTAQFSSPWYWKLTVFVSMHLFLSFFEWGYHRYVLHMFLLKPLRSQYEEHTHHHMQTRPAVGAYPITEPHQTESATFPFYAVMAFWGLFGVFLVALQTIFKSMPIILYSLSAITFSLVLYEVYHALMHMSYEKWMKTIKRFPFLRRSYCFHLMHHENNRVNEAIGGFFLFALWDRVFGTYCATTGLPDKNGIFEIKPKIPVPCKLISFLDERWKPVHQRLSMRHHR